MSRVGALLSEYRKSRRLSQLDLGLLADVSSRHISFIETGRSRPSQSMLLRLADVMNLSHRDSNLLLTTGGFAAFYSEYHLGDEIMQPVREALQMILDNHEPYPAAVLDGGWNLLMGNRPQFAMLRAIFPDRDVEQPFNVIKLLFDDDGFRPLVENWHELAGFMLRRLKNQVLAFPSEELETLYREVLEMNVPDNWETVWFDEASSRLEAPMVTVTVNMGGQRLKLFSTLSQFGTALDVGMSELLIENYFPADDSTREWFQQFRQLYAEC